MRVTHLSALVVSAAGLLALPLAFSQNPYPGYGDNAYGAPQPASNQGFATSRPQQADPGGSSYQSMSPDSWGSSAPAAANPFSTPSYAGQSYAGPNDGGSSFAPRGYANTPPGVPAYQSAPTATAPFQGQLQAKTFVPGTVVPSQAPSFSPQYENTGAPSMQTMLGDQRRTPARTQRPERNNDFRPADFDQHDPRDIPLAPTIPSSIVNDENRSLDSQGLETNEAATNETRGREVSAPDTIGQTPAAETKPNVQPGSINEQNGMTPTAQVVPNEVLGNLDPPQAAESNPATTATVPGSSSVTQTPYAPFAPAAPSTMTQPMIGQPLSLPPGQPPNPALTPYQMPQVFYPAAVQTPTAPTQTRNGQGFGWGNAPGLFSRSKAKQQPPTYRQQEPVELRQRSFQRPQTQPRALPRIPLPFGIGGRHGQTNQPPLQGGPSPNTIATPPSTHYQTRGSQLPHLPPQGQGGVHSGQPFPTRQPNCQFRPDLGQRAPLPSVRNFGTYDSGREEYDFENKKKDYPPFSEILATGRWFGSVEGQLLTPRFNGTTGVLVTDNTTLGQPSVNALAFDYDNELVPRLRLGFESKYGPGFEIDYRQLNAGSDVNQFTSVGNIGSALEFPASGSANSLQLLAFNAGETLTGQHSMKLETFAFSMFKEVQLPITRINGLFGVQFANIEHRTSGVVEAGGAVVRTGNSTSDMRALGPRLRIEYYRPLGHTPVEFITSFGGSLMFGKRDQFINVSDGGSFVRRDVDEMVSTLDFMTGVQMRKRLNENESVFARVGFINQYFSGGGSAGLPDDSFGLRGFSFLVGVNR